MSIMKVASINNPAASSGGLTISDTGIPTAPTAAPGTNTTQLATTAFVANTRNLVTNALASNYSLTTTSLSPVSSALQVTITPRSASSRILICAYDFYLLSMRSDFSNWGNVVSPLVSLTRNLTTLKSLKAIGPSIAITGAQLSFGFVRDSETVLHVDSPGTTSAVTYTIQISAEQTGYQVQMVAASGLNPTIFAMEV